MDGSIWSEALLTSETAAPKTLPASKPSVSVSGTWSATRLKRLCSRDRGVEGGLLVDHGRRAVRPQTPA